MFNNKINNVLSSDGCTSFSIAFLTHSIILLCLSLIFHISNFDKLQYPIIIDSSPVETQQIDYEPIEIEETYIVNDNTSFVIENVDTNISDTSLKIDNITTPSSIDDYVVDDSIIDDAILGQLNDHIGGLGQHSGSGISTQTSSEGALDRLTLEILRNAETKNLIVVWLFDASVSLSYQRKQIHDRFDRILSELDLAGSRKSITHSICSFGSGIKFLTQTPSSNLTTLKNAISSIELDLTGTENTFNAISEVCKEYSTSYVSDRLMIVVFTDEVGDDINLLEKATNLVQSKGSMVYVVGSPAPFGKSKAQFRFVEFDPKYEHMEKWIEVQQGPETLCDLTLDLHSLPIDDETLDSGFGPFALSKICLDTGGIFFSVHPNRDNRINKKQDISPLSSYISRFFNHEIMRLYRPDYRHIGIQSRENNHITKQALIKACSIPILIQGEKIVRFEAFNEGTFVDRLNAAQRFSAKLEPKINEVYNILLQGELAHVSLKDKRWLASYCLAMGRILATKCRIENYNHVLAEAKSGLKKTNPKSNIWILVPSPTLNINNGNLQKQYDKAQQYLRFVVNNFPDTPWALIAQAELDTPFGYSWSEDYQEPPKPKDSNNNDSKPQDDMAKPKLIPKPKRKIDKI